MVFISHRMDELQEIADRSTVLRNGEVVATFDRAEGTPPRLLQRCPPARRSRRASAASAPPPTGWSAPRRRRAAGAATPSRSRCTPARSSAWPGWTATARSGSCAPSRGSTRRIAAACCACADRGETEIASQHAAARRGIAYVPRDRKTEGIFEPLSIVDNFSLPTIGARRDGRPGLRAPSAHALRRYVGQLKIRYGSADQSHHDALRRQPAEGRDRALAGDRARHRGAQRPHARRRRGHQDRHLRPARRAHDLRRGRRDAVDRGARST